MHLLLRPIQSARGIYACYIGGNNFILGKCRGQPSISLWWTKLIQHIHNISQHIIFISTASTFTANSKCSRHLSRYIGENNFSPGELQRPIFNIYMVDKIDPTYTQHITTYNTHLTYICFLRPIQSARGLYHIVLWKYFFFWEM